MVKRRCCQCFSFCRCIIMWDCVLGCDAVVTGNFVTECQITNQHGVISEGTNLQVTYYTIL